jgi:hypothetical protein
MGADPAGDSQTQRFAGDHLARRYGGSEGGGRHAKRSCGEQFSIHERDLLAASIWLEGMT